MNSVLAKDVMTETFTDLQDMIMDIVHRFCRRYRMDFEEVKSLAHEAFVECFGGGYNPKRGAFSTYVYQKVVSKIYEAHRTMMRRHILGKIVNQNPIFLEDNRMKNDLRFIDWMQDLPEDARTVAKLTLDGPKEIVWAFLVHPHHPEKIRNTVQEYLEDIGWTAERISESFYELAEAL